MNSENNYLDDLNFQIDNEKENISIKNLINSIPLNNLNNYYDIETSLFKKKCEKLNLKFYWETESLNFQKEIPYPYYKLFLILFKEISLYIEEIERLNKQLREKDKIKLFSIQNNLKENNDKNSTKIDNEIVKKENKQLKLKLNTSINSQSNYINSSILKNSDYINVNINSKNKSNSYNDELKISNKSKKNFSISQSMNNETNSKKIHNELIKQENKEKKLNLNTSINSPNHINSSILKNSEYINVNLNSKKKSNLYNEIKVLDNTKKNFSISHKEFSSLSMNNEMNSDLIERCINQYDDELYNLNELEEILLNQKKLINIKKHFSKKLYLQKYN